MMLRKLDDFMVKRGGSVDPRKFKNEIFELLSIPAFDQGSPEITEGESIGSAKKVVAQNDVLLSKIVPHIRRCWVVPKNRGYRQIASGEWIQFRSEDLVPAYLRYFLISDPFHSQFMKTVKGVGGSLLRASPEQVAKIEIPLPPLDDQKRIAHLLGNVEGLINRRKQHLQQLDDLIKSVFLEMFGDPVRNERGWDIQPCEKAVLDISSGTSYGGEDRAFVSPDELGVLKISAVTKGTFDPTKFKVVNPAQITKTLRFVKRDDFLFSRANTVELVAACCVVPQDYTQLFLPDKLWVLTLNPELVTRQFFNFLLKNERYRDVVRNLASGGHDSMLNISMKKFMTLGIPCPPIDLQVQFAVIVEKVEGIKTRYQHSLTDLKSLYGALSQRAFKGELDLSLLPLPIEGPEITEEDKAEAEDKQPMEPLFELPAPEDLSVLHSPEGRKTLIDQWLSAWLEQLGEANFTAQSFMETARERLWALAEDDAPSWGVVEYDELKTWVFEALDQCRLQQIFLDEENKVALKATSPTNGSW